GGELAEFTAAAIPECLGDSYQAPDGSVFRVVATTPDLFEKIHFGSNPDGSLKSYKFEPGGRNFTAGPVFLGCIRFRGGRPFQIEGRRQISAEPWPGRR